MFTFPGISVQSQIYESANSLVYRGIREENHQSIILKVLKENYPTPQELTRYRTEYEITRSLNLPGVVKVYDLQKYQNTLVILVEDFGGESLKILMQQSHWKLTLKQFLQIAIAITETLSQIHASHIIHKDINPSNIIFNSQTNEIKIIDFGIATKLSQENTTLKNPNILEGTLAYISPEQTGRMNRSLDYRTDFYSLGVTFYELLTNQLPFVSNDYLELVHCHIAKQPLLPSQINSEIPPIIDNIINKLIAKIAENRYQSALGIKVDLEKCLYQFENYQHISNFTLAEQDICDKLQIPQKLYGREQEITQLLTVFEQVSQQSQMMLISGYSGVGKTALVQEIYKPITQKRGYFIAGKFDQYQRNIPYSAIVNALRELVKQLLRESDENLQQWKEKILTVVGVNGQIIIDVIAEVELIIGKQNPIPELGLAENQNRFNLVFQNFIKVFTKPEHPLVFFIDDLQWADGASLKLIQLLMSADSPGLFLIGAYRNNEVSAVHPLMLTVEEIAKTGIVINQIFLIALTLNNINQIIADTLKCELEVVKDLAELLYIKTAGNPFFMNEFFKSLYTEQLLKFDFESLNWQWDLEQIKQRNFTDNVVELMADKIKNLPENTQDLLKFAACIGNQFDIIILALLTKQSCREVVNNLYPAINDNLIISLNSNEEIELTLLNTESNKYSLAEYKFVHDRIQQAAYSLIPDDTKKLLHLQIGQLLLKNISPEKQEEKIFDIVNQLNFGMSLITKQSEKDELAQLNLRAGKKAKLSAAYQPAFNYLQVGIELLVINSWETNYELTLSLQTEATESAYLSSNFQEMDQILEIVLQKAKNVLDTVPVVKIKISALISQNQPNTAIDTGLKVLKLLGVNLPRKPNNFHIFSKMLETKLVLAGKSISDLFALPQMIEPDNLAAIGILVRILSSVFFAEPKLLPINVFQQIIISKKYGISDESICAFAYYGLILCGVLEDIESGYKFGELSLSLLEKLNAKQVKAKSFFIFYGFIKHWKSHIQETLAPLLEAYEIGLESGDVEYALDAANFYCCHSYFLGKNLSEIEKECADYCQIFRQLKREPTLVRNNILWQTILNLLIVGENPSYLIGSAFDENTMLPLLLQINDRTSIFTLYFSKLMLSFLFEKHNEALLNAAYTEEYIDAATATYQNSLFYFYDSLVQLTMDLNLYKSLPKNRIKKVINNQKKMKKWADFSPMNHLHKYYLVEAEIYRVRGKYAQAIDYYEQAIFLAKENEYIQEIAIAYELAAKFYLAQGKELIAKTYMQEAHYYYQFWSATAKVKHLEQNYPQLLSNISGKNKNSKNSVGITTTNSNSNLDIATVMKASQAISREIMLDKLLSSLMKIVIENAGAQTGYLILSSQGKLVIEAEGNVNSENVNLLQSLPVNNCQLFSESVVNYVARTQQTIVLNNATSEGNFTNDPYIQENNPKSILCVPLINQGELISIIYLENNLTTNAFTPERLEILKLISSQAAISLKNAKFYAEVRENERRLVEINQAYERFVPNQFLQFLKKSSITDVKLGDNIQLEMSVLFSDIRSFTTLSEAMTPEDNFKFINSYLSEMEPIIAENYGFIDKYIGDAIMALFSGKADNAVRAAISMLQNLFLYNERRLQLGFSPIQIGIGINTGSLMLGTVGGQNRMDTTVISDAVNLASRIEGLTKDYNVPLLITEQTFLKLENPDNYCLRMLDIIKVRGKSQTVIIYEVFDADITAIKEGKLITKSLFESAMNLYNQQKFIEASDIFRECLTIVPADFVAKIYLNRCEEKYSRFKIDKLESTLALLSSQSKEFSDSFYQILFTDFPGIKVLFKDTNMEKQKDKLWQSLELMVENLRNHKFTDLLLKGLGATHVKYGVLPEHYPCIGSALIKAFKIHLGQNWTLELEEAWLSAYQVIQTLMIDGAE